MQAQAEAGVVLGGTMLGAAGAEAFAGAGALSVETIRLVKDADGTTDLETLHQSDDVKGVAGIGQWR